ncbi:MAG: DUF4116 domain-containing protein [Gammaproteobacteria bacterium]|nr:DUF4116 domain-containing protein [Gammaproteobacteria bacterium]
MLKTLQLGRIRNDPTQISRIQNPSPEFLVKAVEINYQVIWHLDNPSPELVKLAIKRNIVALRGLPKQDKSIELFAVRNDPRALKYIPDPDEEVQLEAISKNGLLVGLIVEPSETVQKAAVANISKAITRIKHPCLDAQLLALDDNYSLINEVVNADVYAIKLAIAMGKNQSFRRGKIDLKNHNLTTDQWWDLVQEFPQEYGIMNLTKEQKSYAILCG